MNILAEPLVSIIVPVYKSELFLKRCLDSLLLQTFTNFEILLIDDGSPDSSGIICEEYARKDCRIHVFHKDNGGVTSARSFGLKKSVGEYVMFVDSDDSLPKNAISILCEKLIHYKLDIVLGGWNKVGKKYKRIIPLMVSGIFSPDEYIELLLLEKCYIGPVGRLFKRHLFLEDTFDISPEIILNEDLIMNIRLANNASKIGIFPFEVIYNYHQNEGSASTRKITNRQSEILFAAIKGSITEAHNKTFLKYLLRFFYRYKYLRCKHNAFYKLVNDKKVFSRDDKFYYYQNYLIKPNFFWKIAVSLIEATNKIRKMYYVVAYKIVTLNNVWRIC